MRYVQEPFIYKDEPPIFEAQRLLQTNQPTLLPDARPHAAAQWATRAAQ
jgi:hypothetical protein